MPLSFQNTESWWWYTGIICFISTSHSSLFFWTPLSFQNKGSWGWYTVILFVSHHAQIIYIHKFEWVISCTYIMTLPLWHCTFASITYQDSTSKLLLNTYKLTVCWGLWAHSAAVIASHRLLWMAINSCQLTSEDSPWTRQKKKLSQHDGMLSSHNLVWYSVGPKPQVKKIRKILQLF